MSEVTSTLSQPVVTEDLSTVTELTNTLQAEFCEDKKGPEKKECKQKTARIAEEALPASISKSEAPGDVAYEAALNSIITGTGNHWRYIYKNEYSQRESYADEMPGTGSVQQSRCLEIRQTRTVGVQASLYDKTAWKPLYSYTITQPYGCEMVTLTEDDIRVADALLKQAQTLYEQGKLTATELIGAQAGEYTLEQLQQLVIEAGKRSAPQSE